MFSKYEDTLLKAQSETIDLLRFPLILLVILIHTSSYFSYWKPEIELLSAEGLCFLLGYILRCFASVAVPTFFVISGFLFFFNFREFTWSGYLTKIKKRIKSLVIPYIFWNVVVWIALLLVNVCAVYQKAATWNDVTAYLSTTNIRFLWNVACLGEDEFPWLCWKTYNTAPMNIPLWFLRDLIVVTAFSPVVFWIIKKLKIFSIVLLGLAHIFQVWFVWSGLSVTAFFFFSLGAYFTINAKNIIVFCQKYYKAIIAVMSLFLLLYAVPYISNEYKTIINNIFCIPAVFFFFWMAQFFVTNKGVEANPWLVSSCFFIYVTHAASIPKAPVLVVYDYVYQALSFISNSDALVNLMCFLIVPCITATILLIAYYLLARFLPKTEKYICGGR